MQGSTEAMDDATRQFELHRPVLLGLAYRLLGSMWDAEDVVQDAYLRWRGVDRRDIREPRGFLFTVVSRLAMDQLKSSRISRAAYAGPWLPEPVATADLGPLDTVELRDTVAYATLHMMERLTPPERAVFVLREGFDLPYNDIGTIMDRSSASCRQLHHRAHSRLADAGSSRFKPSSENHRDLLSAFINAARTGDLKGLTEVLSEDVTAWNDGGGKVRAALRPIKGRSRVLAFITGIVSQYPPSRIAVVDVNGEPTAVISMNGQKQFVAVCVRDQRIRDIYAVLNPDKLSHLHMDSIQ